jgi:hypothetical protein
MPRNQPPLLQGRLSRYVWKGQFHDARPAQTVAGAPQPRPPPLCNRR